MEINSNTHVEIDIMGHHVVTRVPVTADLTVNIVHTEKELVKLLLEYRDALAIIRGLKSPSEVKLDAEVEDSSSSNQ